MSDDISEVCQVVGSVDIAEVDLGPIRGFRFEEIEQMLAPTETEDPV